MKFESGKIDFITGLFLVLFTLWGVLYLGSAIKEPAKVEREKQLFAYKKELVAEMIQILVELESMNDPVVGEFVNDWRVYYTENEVTTSTLAELKIIREKIVADKSIAKNFTTAHKNKHINDMNSVASPVFGFEPEPNIKPGL